MEGTRSSPDAGISWPWASHLNFLNLCSFTKWSWWWYAAHRAVVKKKKKKKWKCPISISFHLSFRELWFTKTWTFQGKNFLKIKFTYSSKYTRLSYSFLFYFHSLLYSLLYFMYFFLLLKYVFLTLEVFWKRTVFAQIIVAPEWVLFPGADYELGWLKQSLMLICNLASFFHKEMEASSSESV